MKINKYFRRVGIPCFLTITFLSSVLVCKAADYPISTPMASDNTNGVAADNSRQNREDGNKDALTADKQGNSAADINTTKEIRQSVERGDNLSTMAKNVKIITLNGMVTLRGPVRTEAEKDSIQQIAEKIAGDSKVSNQLEIKNNQ